jgi:hypothetical protein
VRRQQSLTHCEKIVASLVELLLKTEEGDALVHTYIHEKHKSKSTHIADIIVAIAFFCEAHPPFVSKHLKTLLPYLKGDVNLTPELSSIVSLKVTEILCSASSLGEVLHTYKYTYIHTKKTSQVYIHTYISFHSYLMYYESYKHIHSIL